MVKKKKRGSGFVGVLIIFVILLLAVSVNLISALYTCSNGGTFVEEVHEIDMWNRRTINGIGIGLIDADEIPALNKLTVELILDAKKVSLNNQTFSEDITVDGKEYTISLVNSTVSEVKIDIDGSSKTLVEKELNTINGLEVLLVSTESEYPRESVILVGKEKVALSIPGNPSVIVKVSEKDYVLELFSASDNDATIKVKKCDKGNLTEIEDIEEDEEGEGDEGETNETEEEEGAEPMAEEDKCRPVGLRGENTYCDESGPVFIQKNNNESCSVNYECKSNSCESEKCVECDNIGFREEDKYCNEDKSMLRQKEKGKSCIKDYECKAEHCEGSLCSEPGFFKKIIIWFKNLFR